LRTVIILVTLVLVTACAPRSPRTLVVTGPEIDFQYAAALARGGNYDAAENAYRKIVAENPESMLAADAEFELAFLHMVPGSPHKDYNEALEQFEKFSNRHPNHRKTMEAKSLQALLKQAIDTGKENDRLKKSIEQLKKVDIRHEERRRK
jgi:outer membrane protein assembly factor BamD (BamD/ComL family)